MIILKSTCAPNLHAFMNIPNKKYHEAIKLGVPNFFRQPTESLGNRDFMPPGTAFWSANLNGTLLGLPAPTPSKRQVLPFQLRQEQVPIVNILKNKRAGLVQFTTGGGKSIIMIALVYYWNTSTLIIVHNKDMVQQFYDAFKKFLNWEIGRLNSDYKNIKPITVTTFNSAKLKQKELTEKGFKTLFIDEADLFFTKKSRNFIVQFPAERVFAFSATTKTNSDDYIEKGITPALEKFYGYKVVGIAKKSVLEEIKYLSYSKKKYCDQFNLPVTPHGNWTEFRQALDQDIKRKQEMMRYLTSQYNEKDRILVLFDRVNDVKTFTENCPIEKKYIIHGKIKKKNRENAKTEFLSKGGIMFAQYQTSSRGVDYPECNKVFLLFPIRSETTLRQAIGRAVRWLPGKKAYIYDFVDNSLYYQWESRIKTYKKYYSKIPITPIEYEKS